MVTSPKAKPSLRQSSRVISGNSSCSGPGRMTAPDRLCPPQVFAFSITATGTSPRRSIVSGSSASSCSSRLAQARPGGAAADDRHADLDQLVLGVEPALDELLARVDRRREGRGRDLPVLESRRARPSPQLPFLAFTASVSLGRILLRSPTIAEVGEFEDRRVRVLVDRDDVLRALHADLVLDRPGDARRRGTASARPSCRSGRSAPRRGTSRRRPPRGSRRRRCCRRTPRQLLGELEALGLAEAAAAGDQDVGALDVDVGAALFAAGDHRRLRGVRAELEARAARRERRRRRSR